MFPLNYRLRPQTNSAIKAPLWMLGLVTTLVLSTPSHGQSLGASTSATLSSQAAADNPVASESDPVNWRDQRIALEDQFGKDLVELAQWCNENGLPQQARATLDRKIDRDPFRQYIFLPPTQTMPEPGSGIEGQWQTKMNELNRKHAGRILDLARQAADAEAGAVSYQLLHEVLHYDPDQKQVREMLGHKFRDNQWRVTSDSITVRKSSRPHDLFGWPAGSYLLVRTPNFDIESTAGEARTRYLAEKLETWHSVWRQAFFGYWSTTSQVSRWFSGKSSARPFRRGTRRFRVIFFPDKASYVSVLAERVPGIGDSSGYYSNTERISFFYDGSQLEEATWRHELTHQLFRESRSSSESAFEKQYFWFDEAIACYFESLCDLDGYVTLGGFETRRMQFARLRFFLERYYIKLAELSAIGRNDFQRRADMKLLYSQGAGVMNMLLNHSHGVDEQATIEFLRLVYKGRLKSGSFERITGRAFADYDARYSEFLTPNADMVARFLTKPESRTELSVAKAGLNQEAYVSIGRCINLNWLDLSGNRITRPGLTALADCDRISQLFMTECQFEAGALAPLLQLENLQELECSGSAIQDQHLQDLGGLKRLVSFRAVGTRIGDRGLAHLTTIASLKTLDVTNTQVTDQGIAAFRARRPDVTVIK